MHFMQILFVPFGLLCLWNLFETGQSQTQGNCILPTKCNNGTASGTNILGNLWCTTICQVACGVGSTSVCQSFEGDRELLGPNGTAHPTKAICQCQPRPGSNCSTILPSNYIAATYLPIVSNIWCKSCNATGTTNCFYDPDAFRFRCDCVYKGFTPCN